MTREEITAALVEAADAVEALDALRDELSEIGRIAAERLYTRGGSYAEAMWDAAPEGTPISGPMWKAIEAGFRPEWKRLERRRGP